MLTTLVVLRDLAFICQRCNGASQPLRDTIMRLIVLLFFLVASNLEDLKVDTLVGLSCHFGIHDHDFEGFRSFFFSL